jgi:hypothetical protein
MMLITYLIKVPNSYLNRFWYGAYLLMDIFTMEESCASSYRYAALFMYVRSQFCH